jgi:hypothetical protein
MQCGLVDEASWIVRYLAATMDKDMMVKYEFHPG